MRDVIYPTADFTQYRNTDGTGAETTSYSYTFFSGTVQMQSMTTSLPVVDAAQNGPDTAATSTDVYDANGNVIWSMDANGFITYNQYDPTTQALIKTIQDVNTDDTSDFDPSTLPSGWTTPSGGGLELITTYQVDQLGRTTEEVSPNGNVTYTVYDDPDHAVFTFPGATESLDDSGNGTLTTTGPVQLSWTQIPYSYTQSGSTTYGTYDETLTFSGTVTVTDHQIVLPGFTYGDGASSGVKNVLDLIGNGSSDAPQFTIQSLSRSLDNAAGQEMESDAYAVISNSTYLATAQGSPYSGSQVTSDDPTGNYDATILRVRCQRQPMQSGRSERHDHAHGLRCLEPTGQHLGRYE